MIRTKGTHTWDIYLSYHRCPHCGYINESRKDYSSHEGKQVMDLDCARCKKRFEVVKKQARTFGPLIGKAQPAEVDWS